MGQRGITSEQVEQALNSPDIVLPTRQKRRKRVMKKINFKTLDVVYEPRGTDKVVLVTAVWLKEEDRKVKEE
ncbi:MAG: DUF4258 domain-containing protein [Omnitrophica bacterium]|nr:DUF4258 domain-containing protein [Candidatus Omnitrophota bacterium]